MTDKGIGVARTGVPLRRVNGTDAIAHADDRPRSAHLCPLVMRSRGPFEDGLVGKTPDARPLGARAHGPA
jgi:hypothetical protein